MKPKTIQDLKDQGLIIFEAISGSRAYGTDLPTSDTDIKGVFVLPEDVFLGLDYIPQISDERNDTVYYELGRFVELLAQNNPNIMELLASPASCVLHKDPLFDVFQSSLFLSKKCRDSFAGYAAKQIKKARGLNKKIHNPVDKKRKSILDFCYVIEGQGDIPLSRWLEKNKLSQSQCGLVNIAHMKGVYALFLDKENQYNFQGIRRKEDANEVALSSIPKEIEKSAVLYFNKEGYSTYCKRYKEYWDWVDLRNESRYENTISHGKNYDAKNMMHTFRLLDMALDIATKKAVVVRRPNREFLLKIRKGEFEYEELLVQAEEKLDLVREAFKQSDLPETPDVELLNSLLVKVRKAWYDLN